MKWIARRKFRKVATIMGIIALILATTMGVFTFFGLNGDNFTVSFSKTDKYSLALYDSEEMNLGRTRLSFPGMNDMDNVTYPRDIPENIEEGMGDKNEYSRKKYIAYSFYLVNHSNVPVDIQVSVDILKVTQNVDAAMRFMLIKDGEREIYAKTQEVGDDIGKPEYVSKPDSGLTKAFLSSAKILEERYSRIDVEQKIKFTIVIWFEGEDAQCVDGIKGGKFSGAMDIWVV